MKKSESIGSLVSGAKQVNPTELEREWIIYIDISSVDREAKRIATPQRVMPRSAPSRARQQVATDDILVGTVRPNLNAVAIVPPHLDGEVASTGFCVLRPSKDRVWPGYLFYFTQSVEFVKRLSSVATGASYPAVTDGDVLSIEISLPSPSEQERIAAILGRAERLRSMRRYALKVADTFLPAVFQKMFGDLRTNEAGWRFRDLEEVADVVSGVTKGQRIVARRTIKVPYLRVANVQDGFLDLSEIKTIQATEEDVEALRLQPGDILMTEGGDFDKLGRGAIWRGEFAPCIHQNHIFRVRLNLDLVLPEFFVCFLRTTYAKQYFLRCSKQTTNLASINMTQLKATPVPVPPLSLQRRFLSIFQGVRRFDTTGREAARQAEHLFRSLLRRTFARPV